MDSMTTEDYKGRTIVLLDFTNAKYLDALQKIGEYKRIISQQKPKSLLTLTDVTGCEVNQKTVQAFKEFALHNKPYVVASAVIGLAGFTRVFVNAINQFSKRDIKLFNNPVLAKDWLATRL